MFMKLENIKWIITRPFDPVHKAFYKGKSLEFGYNRLLNLCIRDIGEHPTRTALKIKSAVKKIVHSPRLYSKLYSSCYNS